MIIAKARPEDDWYEIGSDTADGEEELEDLERQLRDIIKELDDLDEEEEKEEAYDRAMDIVKK